MAQREVLVLEVDGGLAIEGKEQEALERDLYEQLLTRPLVVLPPGTKLHQFRIEVPDGSERRGPLTVVRKTG